MRASAVLGAILTATLVLPSALVATALATATPGTTAEGKPSVQGAIRLDQLGYAPSEHKVAYVIATTSVAGAGFNVRNAAGRTVLHGTVGPSQGPWNATYGAVHFLDLSAIHKAGTYRVLVGDPLRRHLPIVPDRIARATVRATRFATPSRSSRPSATART